MHPWFRQRRIVADVEFDAECGLWTAACPRLGVYTEARTCEELLSRFWSLSGDMATENHLALPHDSRIEFRHSGKEVGAQPMIPPDPHKKPRSPVNANVRDGNRRGGIQ